MNQDGWLQSLNEAVRIWVLAHIPNTVRILVVLVGAWVVIRVAAHLIGRLERLVEDEDPSTRSEAEKRAQTLGRIARQAVAVLTWSVAGMLVLSELGINLGPILAGAGIAGLAVGFGAQTLVKDLIGGFFILFENQFRVGDVISTAGVAGLVESINLRTTVLRDLEARVHVIPNGSIAVLTNFTREWSRPVLDIGVAYKEDTDRCMAVLKGVGDEMEKDPEFGSKLTGPFEYPGVAEFGDSAVVLRVMVPTQPMERWNVLRELNRRVKKAFDQHGIEIPFPHMTLYVGDEASNQRLRVDLGREAVVKPAAAARRAEE